MSRLDALTWDLSLTEKTQECQKKCGKTYGDRRVHIWIERKGIYRNLKKILYVMRKYNPFNIQMS